MSDSEEVVWVNLKNLKPAPWNINEMDYETFLSLMDDMSRKDGPYRINPIRVRPVGENKYEIIDGHQRVEAAVRLGWEKIRAIVTKCSETAARIWNFRLNNERGKINPIREAEFYRYLLDKGWSLHKIERELGIKRQRVQQILKRLKVSEEAKEILEKVPMPNEIQKKPLMGTWKGPEAKHYEAIGKIEDKKLQKEVAKITVEHALPAKQTERLVSQVKKGLKPEEALKIIRGETQPEDVYVFTCSCGKKYMVNWSEKTVKPAKQ
jgi:ParB/RepB/Spo0J family partition protein